MTEILVITKITVLPIISVMTNYFSHDQLFPVTISIQSLYFSHYKKFQSLQILL